MQITYFHGKANICPQKGKTTILNQIKRESQNSGLMFAVFARKSNTESCREFVEESGLVSSKVVWTRGGLL